MQRPAVGRTVASREGLWDIILVKDVLKPVPLRQISRCQVKAYGELTSRALDSIVQYLPNDFHDITYR